MIRNGYLVPAYKSSLPCLKWMIRVRSGKYWCPKVKDIHPANCAEPPKKEDILYHLLSFAKDQGKNLGITEKRVPDKQWMLQVLNVLKPDHHYFRKDFVPKRAIDKLLIDNSDGFFDHLPPGKYKHRIGVVFKEPEENKLKRRMHHY